jgi:hypothetical protein
LRPEIDHEQIGMFGTALTPAFPAEPDEPKRAYAPNPPRSDIADVTGLS